MTTPPEEIECETVRAFVAGKDIKVHHIGSSGGDEGIQHFYRLSGPDAPEPGGVGSVNGVVTWEHSDPEGYREIFERWDDGRPDLHRHLSSLHDED